MLSKKKLWTQLDYDNWRASLNPASNLRIVAKNNTPDLWPCYVLWKDGNEASLGYHGFVYFNEF